jgi:hypothetical protein
MGSQNTTVRCDECGCERRVNFSECLRTGWPKCCKGYTMRMLTTSANIAAAVDDAFAPMRDALRVSR